MKKAYRYALIGIGVVVGLYIAFMGAYYVTSTPGYCTTCHEAKPYVKSWKQSPHRNVKCEGCHEQRGFLGKIQYKARGLNAAYIHLTGQYSGLLGTSQVFEQNCIDCHFGGYRRFPNASKLDRKHYNYVKEGRSCLECHRKTGHEKALVSEEILKSIKE